jgi:hypothetical protein
VNPTKVLVGLVAVVVLLFAVVIGLDRRQSETGGGDPAKSRLAGLRERFVGATSLSPDDVREAPCLGPDGASFVVNAGGACTVDIPGRVRKVVLQRVRGQTELVVQNRTQDDPALPDNKAGRDSTVRLDVYAEGSTLLIQCRLGPSCTVAIGDAGG